MTVSDERPRPAIWGPLLIATCFLAIIGASAGWVLGQRAEEREQQLTEQTGQYSGQAPPDAGDSLVPQDDQTDGGQTDGGQTGGDEPTTRACPGHTQKQVGHPGTQGTLSLELYVRTKQSEVWICASGDGRLFYQGHRGQPGEALVEGENALFLTAVERDGRWYVATNKTGSGVTVYRVSAERLVIIDDGGGETVEPAIG